jgi:PAS domain S-box-containing protein
VRPIVPEPIRAAERTRDIDGRFHDLAAASSDWFWEQCADLRFHWVSNHAPSIGSFDTAHLLGKTVRDLADPDTVDVALDAHREALTARRPFRDLRFECTVDAQRRYLSISGVPFFDPDGAFLGYRGCGSDLTATIKDDAQSRYQAAFLRAMLDHFPAGISVIDRHLNVVAVNRSVFTLLDFPVGLFEAGDPLEIAFRFNAQRGDYGPGDADKQVRERLELAAKFLPHKFERARPDGTVLEVTGNPMGDNGFVTTYTDITARKRAEMELRVSEERLHKSERHLTRAQELAEIGSFESVVRTGETVWSDNMYRMVGVDRATFAVTADSVLTLIHPDDLGRFVAWRASLVEGRDIGNVSYRINHPDGEHRHHVIRGEPIRNADGKVIGILGSVRDVTAAVRMEEQRRALETQLQHSQRLEALGTLAGGVAHEINNALVPVIALTKMVAGKLPDGSRERRNLDTVVASAERSRDLVKQILAFSRKEESQKRRESVDVATVLRDVLQLMRATLPANIRIEEEIAPAPPITGDPSQLHQVIVNVMTNAAQAIGQAQGKITVRLRPETDGVRLLLSIADTGCGMDERTLARVFEPFFTTKQAGEGTGLGLSVAHGIIEDHGGQIDVASKPSQGTRFDIILPLAST